MAMCIAVLAKASANGLSRLQENIQAGEIIVNDQIDLIGLIEKPAARRLWFLYNALQSSSFEHAIDLAQVAEAFVTGIENGVEDHALLDLGAPVAEQEKAEQHVEEASIGSREIEPPTTKRRNGLLPNEQRERLLDRVAEGVRNAELAVE